MIKMTDLHIGGAYLTGGHVFQAASAFAINLILVRYISPVEFGWFAIVFAEASLFYAVLSIRTNALVIRASDAALTEDAKDIYFNVALQETIVATVLIFVWLWMTTGVGVWEAMIILTLALRHWTILNKSFYERALPYKQLSVIETGSALAGQFTALATVLIGGGWLALVFREIVSTALALGGLLAVNGLTFRRIRPLKITEYRSLYKEARGIWLDGVLEGTFQRLTILMAGFLGGEGLAGLVFQAQRLASVPHQILTPFVNRIALNWFARIEGATLRRKAKNKAVMSAVFPLLGIAVLTVLFAEPVVPWLLVDVWSEVAVIMVGMAGFIVFNSPFEILRSYCFVIRHARIVLLARVAQHAGFFVPVLLAYAGFLTNSIGLAYGISIAATASFLCMAWLIRRQERLR